MIRLILVCLFLPFMLPAQIVQEDGSTRDESELYASTKQVNQFFRRFNGEEDQKGKRYYKGDKAFRDATLRRNYISLLFDEDNQSIPNDRKNTFINEVSNPKNPQLLSFHQEGWFAEVNAVFNRNGEEENMLLFFKIQAQGQGYEWVLDHVASDHYQQFFTKDQNGDKSFLHPMSHELDFMNLHKSLNRENVVNYTVDGFKPHGLSIFIYELANKSITFKTVVETKFHFFQCEGWYFQIAEYNRSGYNSGWLIADLLPVQKQDIPKLKAFIYEAN